MTRPRKRPFCFGDFTTVLDDSDQSIRAVADNLPLNQYPYFPFIFSQYFSLLRLLKTVNFGNATIALLLVNDVHTLLGGLKKPARSI